ncbi:hypothetical protein, conserved [Trypanosoma brucei brucei TREU927]|uniref:MORN repeat-containing protein 5 n=1 Tax=Trypanosoma brucei brucei (strain 927/4 GUTat10.1) TaxID=185431 RepID=Q57WE6_TRYB2|nr:hypothetical protein, conserved [Trypanosoma brucei brucei TREU927]AAX70075.1 hypothetical protein, conserved [Trypanosoma brucei]AAZ12395.1 hypothetical protein, conserved [Trypanosoma brucei brucei TREU927]
MCICMYACIRVCTYKEGTKKKASAQPAVMFYTGCSYRGERTSDDRRFDGQGIFTFANGDTYVGAHRDGCMHGHGTLFFAKERGGGHYVGVWENGRNVSGAFVFSDGLVYGSGEQTKIPDPSAGGPLTPEVSETGTILAAQQSGNTGESDKQITNASVSGEGEEVEAPPVDTSSNSTLARNWLYCRKGDRRLWAEHLREVMPVLPLQALLGGERAPQSRKWAKSLVVAPCVAAEAKTPATFAQGQPRCLSDVPEEFWSDEEQRKSVVSRMELQASPFIGAQGGAGREETMIDGERLATNLTLRIIKPLESEAMRRAIEAAALASTAARVKSDTFMSPRSRSSSEKSSHCLNIVEDSL